MIMKHTFTPIFVLMTISLVFISGCASQEEPEDTTLILSNASSMLPTREQIPKEWVAQDDERSDNSINYVRLSSKSNEPLRGTNLIFSLNKYSTIEEANRYYSRESRRLKNGADFSEEFPLDVKNSACFGYERVPTTNTETNQIVYLGIGICIKKNIAFIVQALSSETKDVKSLVNKFIKIMAKNIQ